jgi:hypothetical protein
MKITLVLERGRTENEANWSATAEMPTFFIATMADDFAGIMANVRDLFEDHKEHEGKDNPVFAGIHFDQIEFNFEYDIREIFEAYPEMNVNALARTTGMNPSLLRQYVSGAKFPSATQAKRIETALRDLGQRLTQINIAIPA